MRLFVSRARTRQPHARALRDRLRRNSRDGCPSKALHRRVRCDEASRHHNASHTFATCEGLGVSCAYHKSSRAYRVSHRRNAQRSSRCPRAAWRSSTSCAHTRVRVRVDLRRLRCACHERDARHLRDALSTSVPRDARPFRRQAFRRARHPHGSPCVLDRARQEQSSQSSSRRPQARRLNDRDPPQAPVQPRAPRRRARVDRTTHGVATRSNRFESSEKRGLARQKRLPRHSCERCFHA